MSSVLPSYVKLTHRKDTNTEHTKTTKNSLKMYKKIRTKHTTIILNLTPKVHAVSKETS